MVDSSFEKLFFYNDIFNNSNLDTITANNCIFGRNHHENSSLVEFSSFNEFAINDHFFTGKDISKDEFETIIITNKDSTEEPK